MCDCQMGGPTPWRAEVQTCPGVAVKGGGGERLPLPVLEVSKMGPASSHGALPSAQHYAQGALTVSGGTESRDCLWVLQTTSSFLPSAVALVFFSGPNQSAFSGWRWVFWGGGGGTTRHSYLVVACGWPLGGQETPPPTPVAQHTEPFFQEKFQCFYQNCLCEHGLK